MKNLILLGAFVFVLTLTSCSHSSDAKESNPTKEPTALDLSGSFYKRMKGMLDQRLPITMQISKLNDSILKGSYYYDKIGMPLSLRGIIHPDGTFEMNEWNEQDDITETFTGKFSSSDEIDGTWTNPKTKKTLAFHLVKDSAFTLGVNYHHEHKENCDFANKSKQHPDSLLFYYDTVCSYIDVSLIQIQLENKIAQQNIQESIIKATCTDIEKSYSSLDDFMASLDSSGDMGFMSIDADGIIVNAEHDILSVVINQSSYTGGAHPNYFMSCLNFNVQTGKEINLDELFISGYSPALDQIAEKEFRKQYGDDDWWFFKPGEFSLTDNYNITPGGLLFRFNPYEIGPYAAGAPQIFLSYKSIRHLLKENSILQPYLKK